MSQEMAFNRWLKLRRIALDLTQWDLAERVGCSREAIQKIEAGTRRPSKQIAELLLACLEIPPEERSAFVRWARLGPEAAPRGLAIASPPSVSAAPAPIAPVPPAPPSNIPAPLTSLIGRDEEVEAVRRTLLRDDVRLLSLVGPPGIGKTRLSIAVAARLSAHFRDGVCFVALDAVNDPHRVLAAVRTALGLRPSGRQPVAEAVAQHLRERQLLLVLDNFEQVLDAGPQILQLLSACPGLKALVTSREPLHAYGECRFRVPPLELPDPKNLPDLNTLAGLASVVLFLRRAQARRPDLSLTPANAGAIAAICLHLDGLPLAIELAAAQIEDLTPEQIQAGLGDRLKLLRADLRYLPPRQRTLLGAIGWSYHLLTAGERMLLRRLGVFVGGCDLAAVQAVCNANHDLPFEAQEGVAALSSKSLLYREAGAAGEPRWTMLESIRAYARERLEESGEAPDIRRLHAEYCVVLSETARAQIRGPEQGRWLERLEQEHDNVRAAWEWVIANWAVEIGLRLGSALWLFWEARSHVSEGRRWLDAAFAQAEGPHAGTIPVAVRARAFHAAGALARIQGDFAQAKTFHTQALELWRQADDRRGIAQSLNSLGIVAMYQCEYAQAEAYYEESLELNRQADRQLDMAQNLGNLGVVVMYQGHYERALWLHRESMRIYQALGNGHSVAGSLGNQGDVLRYMGERAQARQVLERSLDGLRAIEDRQGTAITLCSLGRLALDAGEIENAKALFRESLALCQQVGDRLALVDDLEGLAWAAGARKQAGRVARLYGAEAALREAIGAPLPSIDHARHARVEQAARAELCDEEFARTWQAGRAMTLEQAIEYALTPDE